MTEKRERTGSVLVQVHTCGEGRKEATTRKRRRRGRGGKTEDKEKKIPP
jgi:hypothetical protein